MWATPLEPHPRGRTFTIVSEARVGDELVWEGVSTMLRRGGGSGAGAGATGPAEDDPAAPSASAEWRLPGDLGRRYASVSGRPQPDPHALADGQAVRLPARDRPRDVDEGALPGGARKPLPDAFAVEVRFRRPILLPGTVAFASEDDGDAIASPCAARAPASRI